MERCQQSDVFAVFKTFANLPQKYESLIANTGLINLPGISGFAVTGWSKEHVAGNVHFSAELGFEFICMNM